MNYLAHIFLSGKDPEILVGNLLEDFIKGRIEHKRNDHLTPKMKLGLELHRLIDTYMDSSEMLKEGKQFFYKDYGKYTPAVMDIIFDYFLTKNWKKYTNQEFEAFRLNAYKSLSLYHEYFPPKMKTMVESMRVHDWLKSYGDYDSLSYVMSRFTLKVGNTYDFTGTVPILKENEKDLDRIFNQFFPKMKDICDTFLLEKLTESGS